MLRMSSSFRSTTERARRAAGGLAVAAAVSATWMTGSASARSPRQDAATADSGHAVAKSLDDTREILGKWIETQQIISQERAEWQQAREMLTARAELIKAEIASLEEKIVQAQASVDEANRKRDAALAENAALKEVGGQLTAAVTRMEGEVRRLFKVLPEPLQTRLVPLSQRIPEDAATTRVSSAERFQNVLGILNEVNKANNEITVSYEVHNLASGKPSEVQAIYVGLAQAYFVAGSGEAGIGRPDAEGWTWEPSKAIGRDVLTALEIIQGKHPPQFVGLPLKMQ